MPSEAQDKLHLLWNLVTDFCESFKNQILGKYDNRRSVKLKDQKYTTGALIRLDFNRLFKNLCARRYKATQKYTDNQIQEAITLHQGDSLPGFPSIDAFLYLLMPQIELLKEPAHDCLNNCFIMFEGLADEIIQKIFFRFPELHVNF